MSYVIPILPNDNLSNIRQVELHIESHPNCTARDIADAIGFSTNAVSVNLCRLRAEGRIKRVQIEGDKRVRWAVGVDDAFEVKEPSEGRPNRRMVSEWTPHMVRDPLVAYLFG